MPFRLITGFIVSIVTKEPSLISLFVISISFPLEFVRVIENVTFPLVSPGKTVVWNVALPPLVVFIEDLPSMVPVKLPRSLLVASSSRVMILLAFAKLSPEELLIVNDVIGIGSSFTTSTFLVLVTGTLPAESVELNM